MSHRPPSNLVGLALGILILATPAANAGLTAGDVDDNLNFGAFQTYAAGAANGALPDPNLSDRLTLRVRSADEAPVSWARVVYRNADEPGGRSAMAFTGADGVARLFPTFELGGHAQRLKVDVYHAAGQTPAHSADVVVEDLTASRMIDVTLSEGTPAPTALDLAIVLDTTGSMGDEFQYLSSELEGIVSAAKAGQPGVSMRFALIVYKDHGDQYVVRTFPFTDSLASMQSNLAAQQSGGGGDMPEAVEEALEAAVQLDWRGGNTAKLMWLVADAPPHVTGYDHTMAAFRAARESGIHIYPVGASGVADAAEYLFRMGALLTQGRYAFLTDDSGIGNAHAEPHIPCYQVTELSDLLARIVQGELAGHRVEAAPEEVVRTVGDFNNGVCLVEPEPQPEGGAPSSPKRELPGTSRSTGYAYDGESPAPASVPGLGAPLLLLALAGVALVAARGSRGRRPPRGGTRC